MNIHSAADCNSINYAGLVIAQEGWTPRLRSECWPTIFAGRALTQVGVRQGPEKLGTGTFKIVGAPHMTPHMVSIGR
jgi:hypothetical protein